MVKKNVLENHINSTCTTRSKPYNQFLAINAFFSGIKHSFSPSGVSAGSVVIILVGVTFCMMLKHKER